MTTRSILTCIRADKSNLCLLLRFRGHKLTAENAKTRIGFAQTVIEFYAFVLLMSYRTEDSEACARELNWLRDKATKLHIEYARLYPATFSGFVYEFPTLDRLNALTAAKPTKTTESDGQTALPFDNSNALEKRLDRLESILVRLDRHLQPTEEK